MRREPADFGDQEIELVHISRTLREAKAVEALLTDRGVDYTVVADRYRAKVLFVFPTERVGAFFYVPVEAAAASRDLIAGAGHAVL